jgi:ABC-type uncharacterized transport system substrate-binding protein
MNSQTVPSKKLKWLGLSVIAFVLVVTGAAAQAQQSAKVPRIGYLTGATPDGQSARIEAFRLGLRELGYVEGKNIVIEYRYAELKPDRVPALAAELVRLKVDVVVTSAGGSTRAAKEATNTIPIVMAQDNDPVANGFVASLARPGRKHHGTVQPCPGDKRKTTGASEGDHSQTLPRGRRGGLRPPTPVKPNI